MLRFQPIYQQRVWGGNQLAHIFGRALPPDEPIGESWDLVDREEAQSVVASGPFAGQTLRQVMHTHSEYIMGKGWERDKPFPILVKWLDCKERLSLQVHPPATVANALKGEPKAENWFIAGVGPGASLIAGLKRGTTREQFKQAIQNNSLESYCHRFEVDAGGSIFIPSGRIHAIDAGNLILEIQENSDTTYRVYDWGRVGLDGQPRALHIEASLESIDFDDFEPAPIPSKKGDQLLVNCPQFRIQKLERSQGEPSFLSPKGHPRLLSVVKGTVIDLESGGRVNSGDTVLLPAGADFELSFENEVQYLLTDQFSS